MYTAYKVNWIYFKKIGHYFYPDYGLLSYDRLQFYRLITAIDNNMHSQFS
jgi:hypothetical protein